MRAVEPRLLLTCEHGGNRVPRGYRSLFEGVGSLLQSHHAWDPGSLTVARSLARAFHVNLIAATTTRLLVDLNRSPYHPAVTPGFAAGDYARANREALLAQIHRPHWNRVRSAVGRSRRRVVHVAVHSFTPVLRGERRDFEVGILYDPSLLRECEFAAAWQREMKQSAPEFRVRRNAPYRGTSDGLTTALRKEFSPSRYVGIELELNQQALSDAADRRTLTSALVSSLRRALRPDAPH